MRLRGKHAMKVVTLEDAFGKLGAGKLTQAEYAQMQTMVGKVYGGPTIPGLTIPMAIPHNSPTKVR